MDELSYLKGKSEHCQVELVTVTTEYDELIEQYEVQKRQIEVSTTFVDMYRCTYIRVYLCPFTYIHTYVCPYIGEYFR